MRILGPSTAARSRGLLLAAAMLASSAGCEGQAKSHEEGRNLVEAINAVQDVVKLGDRQQQLDALAKLPLTAASHVHVRDVCVAAHRQLLQAEVEQATAKQAIERATPPGAGAVVSKEAGQAISEAIARSDAALQTAQKTFPECQHALQGLIAELR